MRRRGDQGRELCEGARRTEKSANLARVNAGKVGKEDALAISLSWGTKDE